MKSEDTTAFLFRSKPEIGFWVFASLSHTLSFFQFSLNPIYLFLFFIFYFFPSKFSLSSFLSLSSILGALSLFVLFFFWGNPLVWVGLAREKIHTWMMLISYHHHHGRHSYMHELPNGDLTRHGGLKVSFFFFFFSLFWFLCLSYLPPKFSPLWRERVYD